MDVKPQIPINNLKLIQEQQAIEINNTVRFVFHNSKTFEIVWFVAKTLASDSSSALPGVSDAQIKQAIPNAPSALTQYWWSNVWGRGKERLKKLYRVYLITQGADSDITDQVFSEKSKSQYEDFLRYKLFPRIPPTEGSGLHPSTKLFSVTPGAKKELVRGSKPYDWESSSLQKKGVKEKDFKLGYRMLSKPTRRVQEIGRKRYRLRQKDLLMSIPSSTTFELLMQDFRILHHYRLEEKSAVIFDAIYKRCLELKKPKDPIEIAKVIRGFALGYDHPELFEGWDSPTPGLTLLEWVKGYEDKKLKQFDNPDFLNTRLGKFILEMVRQELDKYDPLFEAIRAKESEENIRKIWDNLKPRGFFKDVFLSHIILLLDKPMVNKYRADLNKLKKRPSKEQ